MEERRLRGHARHSDPEHSAGHPVGGVEMMTLHGDWVGCWRALASVGRFDDDIDALSPEGIGPTPPTSIVSKRLDDPVTAANASTASSCFPLKWWYMLPWPTPARAITSRGLVAA